MALLIGSGCWTFAKGTALASFVWGTVSGGYVILILLILTGVWERSQIRPFDEGAIIAMQDVILSDEGVRRQSTHYNLFYDWTLIHKIVVKQHQLFLNV